MSRMSEYSHDIQDARETLEMAGFRVLAPFTGRPREYIPNAEQLPSRVGVFVDTETTGDDPKADQIIQLAMVPFQYEPGSGRILSVGAALIDYEYPTVPISPEAQAVHGITAEELIGKCFDEVHIRLILERSDIIVAHNTSFDRPFLDRRFGHLFAGLQPDWGCSIIDIPWKKKAGYPSAALGALLTSHASHFFAGHDAGEDCYAALHCLAHPFPDGTYPFANVLTRLSTPTFVLFACGAPYNVKDTLRRRGYRWNDPTAMGAPFPKGPKAWYCEVTRETMDDEYAWLNTNVYMFADARRRSELVEIPNHRRFQKEAGAN